MTEDTMEEEHLTHAENIVLYLEEHPEQRADDIARGTGIKLSSVKPNLCNLLDMGRIEKTVINKNHVLWHIKPYKHFAGTMEFPAWLEPKFKLPE